MSSDVQWDRTLDPAASISKPDQPNPPDIWSNEDPDGDLVNQ